MDFRRKGTYQNLFSYFLYNNFYIIKLVVQSKYNSKIGQRHLEDQQYEKVKDVKKMHPPAKIDKMWFMC